MKDISNSTLVLFVVLAIVVSVFGTFLSIGSIGDYTFADVALTGMATTGTGIANLSVSAEAAIFMSDDEVQLGVIEINYSNSSLDKADYWQVQNVGGINISVRLWGDQPNGAGIYADDNGIGDFETIAGDAYAAGSCLNTTASGSHDCFRVACNGTASGDLCITTWTPLNDTSPGDLLLNDLSWQGGDNFASFMVNVTVPPQEGAGEKTQTVTFVAADSSS